MKVHANYSSVPTTVTVQGESIELKPYQIVVWVSIAAREVLEWEPRFLRIPAIVDTGNNYGFSISEQQLMRWTEFDTRLLPQRRMIREKGKRIPIYPAALWLHADKPRRLNLGDGIAVYREDGPRLPLLGLRLLTQNKLRVLIHGDEMQAIIRTPPKWYWPF